MIDVAVLIRACSTLVNSAPQWAGNSELCVAVVIPERQFKNARRFRVTYLSFCYIFYAASSFATEPIDYRI